MDEELKPEDALAINLWTFRLTGAWPADIDRPIFRHLYSLYAIGLLSFFTVAYFTSEVVAMTLAWGELEAMTELSFLFLTHIGTAVKLANFLIRQKQIEKLILDLNQPKFQSKRPEHRVIMESAMQAAFRDSLLFITICASTVITWAICPLVNRKKVNELPLKSWFPFDTTETPAFQLVYIYQTTAVMINACMNPMMDTVPSGLMALMFGQLEILEFNLRFLKEDAMLAVQHYYSNQMVIDFRYSIIETENTRERSVLRSRDYRKERNINHLVDYKWKSIESISEFQDALHERIVQCVVHHEAIVDFAQEIKRLFQIGILVQFLISSAIICLTCFRLTLVSPISVEFFSMLLYQACMLYEIFCYCWRGNEIIIKSSELTTAAYNCDWTGYPEKFKTSLRILMCRMQRPLKLNVGGFFMLSLSTFSAIEMKAALALDSSQCKIMKFTTS